MNPQTMTLDEVRDELARMDGWEVEFGSFMYTDYSTGTTHVGVQRWLDVDGVKESFRHPHPATLDGAAAALPKGWNISMQIPPNMRCEIAGFKTDRDAVYVYAPDEITARYRLALACRIAEMEGAE